jgi:acyl-CoA reductase-like NAD-dependent aldehyde dehydrogenase
MAVKGAIASKYRNADHTCVCANRIVVKDGVYNAFTKRLAQTAGAMKVAQGVEPGAVIGVIGPLIDRSGGAEPPSARSGIVPSTRSKETYISLCSERGAQQQADPGDRKA